MNNSARVILLTYLHGKIRMNIKDHGYSQLLFFKLLQFSEI